MDPHLRTDRVATPSPLAAGDLLARHLADPRAGWSVGVWGGIAEFQYDEGEAVTFIDGGRGAVTARGGIRLARDVAPRALELRRTGSDHVDEIAFCVAADAAAGGATTVVELGPDADALDPAARGDILFDLGLGAAHVSGGVRVRAGDAALLAALRAGRGRAILDPANPAGAAVVAASPARVFRSPVARIEVYQPIPPADGRAPQGPHTHLLPALLRERRAHAPDSPIPEGWLCALSLYPRTRI
ncbi:MAG: hypothetical protein IPK81_19380 [Rhodospirillales bacterium]|nr:MAG: hypothetical protein IPK81_19380 [Rhodospirillales bacterium]